MLPAVHGFGAAPCACSARVAQTSAETPLARSGSSDSPLVSPKRTTPQPRPACTCNVRQQYQNYDIPRAALANLYLKEQSKNAADFAPDLQANDPSLDAAMHYDIPKKYKQAAFGLPGERYAAGLKGSSESSTTSSDSDYIETLSLCSSGSNGSGSEYLRCEDIAAGKPAACPVSCGLKPRSAKEYNAVDRSAIRHDMHEEGLCGALHSCHRTHHHAPIHLTLPKVVRSAPPPSPVQGNGARGGATKPSPAAS
ncbi:hypothetical protein V5799_016375 [Amblyomma americanum]